MDHAFEAVGVPDLVRQAIESLAIRGTATRASGKPHNEARDVFREIVTYVLTERAIARIGKGWLTREDRQAWEQLRTSLTDELADNAAFTAALDDLWPILTPQTLLSQLYSSAERLRAAHADEALFRADGEAWTVSDVPLLDELVDLLGRDKPADDTAERQRAVRRKVATGRSPCAHVRVLRRRAGGSDGHPYRVPVRRALIASLAVALVVASCAGNELDAASRPDRTTTTRPAPTTTAPTPTTVPPDRRPPCRARRRPARASPTGGCPRPSRGPAARATPASSAPRSVSRSTGPTLPATRSPSPSPASVRPATASVRCSPTRAARAPADASSSSTSRSRRPLQERFDIVSWDPRGVGASTHLFCGSKVALVPPPRPRPRRPARAARDRRRSQGGSRRVRGEGRPAPPPHRHRRHRSRHGGDPARGRRPEAQLHRVQLRHVHRRAVPRPVPDPRAGDAMVLDGRCG